MWSWTLVSSRHAVTCYFGTRLLCEQVLIAISFHSQLQYLQILSILTRLQKHQPHSICAHCSMLIYATTCYQVTRSYQVSGHQVLPGLASELWPSCRASRRTWAKAWSNEVFHWFEFPKVFQSQKERSAEPSKPVKHEFDSMSINEGTICIIILIAYRYGSVLQHILFKLHLVAKYSKISKAPPCHGELMGCQVDLWGRHLPYLPMSLEDSECRITFS